jgi:Flp pilus assembly protein TadB
MEATPWCIRAAQARWDRTRPARDDPRLATITDSGVTWPHRRSVALVILGIGLVGLVGGVVVTVSLPLSVVLTSVGFVMMATGAWLLGRVRRSRR